MSNPLTISPYIKLDRYYNGLHQIDRAEKVKRYQDDFLQTWRSELKSQVIQVRGYLGPQLQWLVDCPVCGKPNDSLDMHEVFVSRGEVINVPYEIAINIHVPQNVVLVCHGKCHQDAQTSKKYIVKTIDNIRQYHDDNDILQWLLWMQEHTTTVKAALWHPYLYTF